jgi:hypothetical protein
VLASVVDLINKLSHRRVFDAGDLLHSIPERSSEKACSKELKHFLKLGPQNSDVSLHRPIRSTSGTLNFADFIPRPIAQLFTF